MIVDKSTLKTQVGIMLPKELVKQFKIVCAEQSKTQNALFKEAVIDLIEKYKVT